MLNFSCFLSFIYDAYEEIELWCWVVAGFMNQNNHFLSFITCSSISSILFSIFMIMIMLRIEKWIRLWIHFLISKFNRIMFGWFSNLICNLKQFRDLFDWNFSNAFDWTFTLDIIRSNCDNSNCIGLVNWIDAIKLDLCSIFVLFYFFISIFVFLLSFTIAYKLFDEIPPYCL